MCLALTLAEGRIRRQSNNGIDILPLKRNLLAHEIFK